MLPNTLDHFFDMYSESSNRGLELALLKKDYDASVQMTNDFYQTMSSKGGLLGKISFSIDMQATEDDDITQNPEVTQKIALNSQEVNDQIENFYRGLISVDDLSVNIPFDFYNKLVDSLIEMKEYSALGIMAIKLKESDIKRNFIHYYGEQNHFDLLNKDTPVGKLKNFKNSFTYYRDIERRIEALNKNSLNKKLNNQFEAAKQTYISLKQYQTVNNLLLKIKDDRETVEKYESIWCVFISNIK